VLRQMKIAPGGTGIQIGVEFPLAKRCRSL
jgi:hypothetical protein